VQVDADVVRPQQGGEVVRPDAEGRVDDVELRLRAREEALAVLGRAPDEQDRRPGGGRADRGEEPVGDRQRQRAPDRHEGVGGRDDQRVEGHQAVEVARVHGGERPAAPAQVGMRAAPGRAWDRLGEEAEHGGAQAREGAGRQHLGAEHHDDVGRERLEPGEHRVRIPAGAELDEGRPRAGGVLLERARLEERGLSHEGQPQRRPVPGDGVRSLIPAHDRRDAHRRAHARRRRRDGPLHAG
jgi:hypothetical protein